MMNKFGGGATAELPPGGRGGHFPKWPPQPPGDIHMIIFNTYNITYTELHIPCTITITSTITCPYIHVVEHCVAWYYPIIVNYNVILLSDNNSHDN